MVLGQSNMVGHGRFGLVYQGVLHDGRKIVVKLMDRTRRQGKDEFKVEMKSLSRFRSPICWHCLGTTQIITTNCWFMISWANLTIGPSPMSLYAKSVKRGLNLRGPVWLSSNILRDQPTHMHPFMPLLTGTFHQKCMSRIMIRLSSRYLQVRSRLL